MSACSWNGRKGEELRLEPGHFPCFRKASVTIRESHGKPYYGNPFKERDVCRVHADEMIASGFYFEVAA